MSDSPEEHKSNRSSQERSLSPVLTSYSIDRRYLKAKRFHKKSRVNLADRFQNEGASVNDTDKTDDLPLQFSDTITATQTDSLFDNIEASQNSDLICKKPMSPLAGFQTEKPSARFSDISDSSLESRSNKFSLLCKNKQMKVCAGSKNIFQDEDLSSFLGKNTVSESVGFKSVSYVNKDSSFKGFTKDSFEDSLKRNQDHERNETSCKKMKTEKSAVNIFKDDTFNLQSSSVSFGFVSASGNKISERSLGKAQNIFKNIDNQQFSKASFTSGSDTPLNTAQNFSIENSASNTNHVNKPHCKPSIQISNSNGLIKTKSTFKPQNSPLRPDKIVFNSTPVKDIESALNSFLDTTITPIKKEISQSAQERGIFMQEPTPGDAELWAKNLDQQIHRLASKRRALAQQQDLLKNSTPDHRKRRLGVLFTKKHQSVGRKSLKVGLDFDFSAQRVSSITPQNADLVHFDYSGNCESGTVVTLDGACIVPNQHDIVGLSEIEVAFKAMPGVEPKLVPNGWVRNHYKWVVWKLACYQRFSKNLRDCLSVENVVQQLKYRYDREIDGAERPTLRKIYEKDDVPQKRMVLCVSHIYILPSNKFDLELTDGWYSIRTTLDEPLEEQVIKDRIQVGTKLAICGAELLNCEGCHPLEDSDAARLKISYNSTRRAAWYAKLGYQKISEPFPILLETVLSSGGVISCIKIYIARVYPVKYLERQGNMRVWRNKKAEERRAQDWENERIKQVEAMVEIIERDYEKSLQSEKNKYASVKEKDISNIDCPETLYKLFENSNDPETFHQMLSTSQRQSVSDYQQRISFSKQEELRLKVKEGVEKLEISTRDVTSVLKLQIFDALDQSCNNKFKSFQIWKPSESHLEVLKEGLIFCVYNVLSRHNGDLSSMRKTLFKPQNEDSCRYNKLKRSSLLVSNIYEKTQRQLFGEFDTVGMVIRIEINNFDQHLWIADFNGRLLFIKIYDGPKNCLLLDNLKSGQVISALNLILSPTKFDFVEAVANHCSVISLYPRHKHLQDGIEEFKSQMTKDVDMFVNECAERIKCYVGNNKNDSSTSFGNSVSLKQMPSFLDSTEEDTLVYSGLTSTDVAMSMIDIDKLV